MVSRVEILVPGQDENVKNRGRDDAGHGGRDGDFQKRAKRGWRRRAAPTLSYRWVFRRRSFFQDPDVQRQAELSGSRYQRRISVEQIKMLQHDVERESGSSPGQQALQQ